jgi:hypothetical protein
MTGMSLMDKLDHGVGYRIFARDPLLARATGLITYRQKRPGMRIGLGP